MVHMSSTYATVEATNLRPHDVARPGRHAECTRTFRTVAATANFELTTGRFVTVTFTDGSTMTTRRNSIWEVR